MTGNEYGFIVLLLLGIGLTLLVYLLVHRSLRALLAEVVGLPACTTFYARLLLLGLLFIGLATTIDTRFDFKPGTVFMEYVWRAADALSSTFGETCLFMAGYLLVVTILVAVHRRHE